MKATENGWTVHYVTSGMGSLEDDNKDHANAVPAGSLQYHYPDSSNIITQFFKNGAYVYAEVSGQQATFNYYDGKNKPLHQFTVGPRN